MRTSPKTHALSPLPESEDGLGIKSGYPGDGLGIKSVREAESKSVFEVLRLGRRGGGVATRPHREEQWAREDSSRAVWQC